MSEPRSTKTPRPTASRLRPGPEARAPRRRPDATPVRVALVVGLLLGLVLLGYGVFLDRGGSTQLGFVLSGLVVCGLDLIAASATGAVAVIRNGRRGRESAAFWAALIGGLCAIGAAGCLSGALILLLVSGSAS
jgi:hypothetical protein